MEYYYSKNLGKKNMDEVINQVEGALKEKGFGILTEINVKETFKKKLDIDFRPYRILGACNPQFAHQAIGAEPQIGTMLPCNVVVQENEKGEVVVSAVNPVASMQSVKNEKLGDIASEVRDRLKAVIENL